MSLPKDHIATKGLVSRSARLQLAMVILLRIRRCVRCNTASHERLMTCSTSDTTQRPAGADIRCSTTTSHYFVARIVPRVQMLWRATFPRCGAFVLHV